MTTLVELTSEISTRVTALRAELRQGSTTRATLPEAMKLDGDVYVDSLGTVARITNGTGEFFYTPDAALLRGPVLQQLATPRGELYRKLGSQLRSNSRVLVIGAGSDVDALQCLRSAGHEVIATDFAEDVVQALRRRIDIPAFACDLIHLDRVLPEPVDYIVGNSVLGYLDPSKTKRVIANIWNACTEGAVFTFDQSPHPAYFDIAENQTEQVLVNPSGSDPRRLSAYIERLGASAGIAAMAIYSYNRGRSINLATISMLSQLFIGHGGRVAIGEYDLVVPGAGTHPDHILRVAKGDANILGWVDGEEGFQDAHQALRATGVRPGLQLLYVDRGAGETLARALGIHTEARRDAWEVIRYVAENQPTDADLLVQQEAALAELNPTIAAARILTAIEANAYVPTRRMRQAVAIDQAIHKGIVVGTMAAPMERADLEIDRAYAEERQATAQRKHALMKAQSEKDRRDGRKQQKKARKKQRGG